MCATTARCCHCPRKRALKLSELEVLIRMSVSVWCGRVLVPDRLARVGMRKLMALRLVDESAGNGEARAVRFSRFLADLRASPIAIETGAANEQHYEVPAEFFHLHLGPRLKYSCCLYPDRKSTRLNSSH